MLCVRKCLGEEAMMRQQQGQGAETGWVRRKGSLNQLGKFSIVLFVRQPCWCFGKSHQWFLNEALNMLLKGEGGETADSRKEGLNSWTLLCAQPGQLNICRMVSERALDPNHAESRLESDRSQFFLFFFSMFWFPLCNIGMTVIPIPLDYRR